MAAGPVTGACLALFLRTQSVTWSAVGMGLFAQAAVMLLFDLVAERRARTYMQWLSTLAGSAKPG